MVNPVCNSKIGGCIILVLYADAKIILRNNYEETNNNLYLILLFILMILYLNRHSIINDQ